MNTDVKTRMATAAKMFNRVFIFHLPGVIFPADFNSQMKLHRPARVDLYVFFKGLS